MAEAPTHRFVETNGIKLHIAEMGSGPTVILLHGFPETWYNWRFQLKGLADAGFHVVAPDLRGFGLSKCPLEKAIPFLAVSDIVKLIYEFGGDPVFIVGHDVGAFPGWNLCLMRPDLVRAYVSIGIPFIKPGVRSVPTEEGFYVNRFAIPGRAEKDFGRFDTAKVIENIYILFSRSELQIAGPDEEIMDLVKPSEKPPSWFTEEVLKTQTELYEHSGLEGPLSFTYRGHEEKAELLGPWLNAKVSTPCLYLTGQDDYVRKFPFLEQYVRDGAMKLEVVNLKDVVVIPGGHFVEEDSPDLVNTHLIKFFKDQLAA